MVNGASRDKLIVTRIVQEDIAVLRESKALVREESFALQEPAHAGLLQVVLPETIAQQEPNTKSLAQAVPSRMPAKLPAHLSP